MHITFAPRGILQIDDARITHQNFSGAPSKFNREGDRNFSLKIEDRDLTMDEVKNIEEIYRAASILVDDDGRPVLDYDGLQIITVVDILKALGWNVKVKPPRNEDEEPFIYMPVKIKFNDRGPAVYLKSGNSVNQLNEDTIGILDDVEIDRLDMDIRPYDWEVNGKTGRTAYLQGLDVVQKVDRFAERYRDNF